jgi:hypothetical protein
MEDVFEINDSSSPRVGDVPNERVSCWRPSPTSIIGPSVRAILVIRSL